MCWAAGRSTKCIFLGYCLLVWYMISLYLSEWSRFHGSYLHHGYQPTRWVLCQWLCYFTVSVLMFVHLLDSWRAAIGGSGPGIRVPEICFRSETRLPLQGLISCTCISCCSSLLISSLYHGLNTPGSHQLPYCNSKSPLLSMPSSLIAKHTSQSLCENVPGLYWYHCRESWVAWALTRGKMTRVVCRNVIFCTIYWKDCNEASCFISKKNYFYEYHYM